VIRLLLHFFEPQFPTREQRPKLTEGGGAWRQLAQAIAKHTIHHAKCPKALAWDIPHVPCTCPRGWPRKSKPGQQPPEKPEPQK
jgi:hypothetical protein